MKSLIVGLLLALTPAAVHSAAWIGLSGALADNYYDFGDSAGTTGAMTALTCVDFSSFSSINEAHLISKFGASGSRGWTMYVVDPLAGGTMSAGFSFSNAPTVVDNTEVTGIRVATGVPNCFAMVWTPSNYFRGFHWSANMPARVIFNKTHTDATQNDPAVSLLVGGRVGCTNCSVYGKVSHAAVWHRALSDAEVLAVIADPSKRALIESAPYRNGLRFYAPFNDFTSGTSTTGSGAIKDRSGNGFNGTVSGSGIGWGDWTTFP